MGSPLSNGSNGGRNANGQFAKGWKGGPGSPHAAKVAEWRQALVDAVTPEDLTAVVQKLVERAKAGESWAVRELMDRTVGKPVEPDLIARIEALEQHLIGDQTK